jgi:hypothetical protein
VVVGLIEPLPVLVEEIVMLRMQAFQNIDISLYCFGLLVMNLYLKT